MQLNTPAGWCSVIILRLDDRLAAYWNFEGGGRGTLKNKAVGSLGKLDGEITGAGWIDGRWIGKGALSFDGGGDFVNLGTPNLVNGLRSVTIKAWVNIPFFTPGHRGIFSHPYVLYVGIWGSGMALSAGDGQMWLSNTGNLGSLAGLEDEWIHLAYVKEWTTARAYINGVSTGLTLSVVGILRDNEAERALGKVTFGGSHFNWYGLIDEVAIFNRAMDATEILSHYKMGRP